MKAQAEKEGTRPTRGRRCPKGGVLGSGRLTSHICHPVWSSLSSRDWKEALCQHPAGPAVLVNC